MLTLRWVVLTAPGLFSAGDGGCARHPSDVDTAPFASYDDAPAAVDAGRSGDMGQPAATALTA